jgi:hypothetical protein
MLVSGKIYHPTRGIILTNIKVSGSEGIRDNLRFLVGQYLDEGVRFLELDYQPLEK